MSIRFAVVFLMALPSIAQEAKVIELGLIRADVEQLYRAKIQAEKDWEAEVKKIETLYLVVGEDDPEHGNTVILDSDRTANSSVTNGAIGSTATIAGWSNDPCSQSWQAVACLEKQLKEAKEREAHGQKPEPRVKYKYLRAGWENGFEFSKDFKFIIPKQPLPSTPQPFMSWTH